jgi:hypothetical protein
MGIGPYGYVGTGYQPGGGYQGYMNDWWQYDTNTDNWAQRAYFAGGPTAYAGGFSIGAQGYIGGGGHKGTYGVTYTNLFWQYVPGYNAWYQRSNLPFAPRAGVACFNYGSYGAVMGGIPPDGPNQYYAFNDFWYYDPSGDNWFQDPNYGGIARAGAVGFTINSVPYVGGGFSWQSPTGYLNDFWYLTYVIQ